MSYTPELSARLMRDSFVTVTKLQALMLRCVEQGQSMQVPRAREYMLHGAGRRIGVLTRAVEKIFATFPPSLERPLARDALADIQINLHAFVINLSGVLDNWAWAFVHRHGLQDKIGSRKNVGLFKAKTQAFLPAEFSDYVTSGDIAKWHRDYVTGYRDALAHRIPLYLPPVIWTPEEAAEHNRLGVERGECIRSFDWDRLDRICALQDAIGRPCFTFLHSFSGEDTSRPVYLHPQLLCDSTTVLAIGDRFLRLWADVRQNHSNSAPGQASPAATHNDSITEHDP
jgi:hypothetical protein